MSLNRVVITGIGAVSPYGIGVPVFIDKLFKGESAVVNMEKEWSPAINDLMCYVGAPLMEPINVKGIPRKFRKTMGKTAVLTYLAVNEAIEDAQLNEALLSSGRLGISFGSSTGSAESTERYFVEHINTKSARSLPSGIFFQVMSHTSAANIAQAFNISGRVISPNSACSSSAQAIGFAFEMIQCGHQDIMLCGGSDELHVTTAASFDLVQAGSFKYNNNPSATPRPFDQDRDGTVCGEGAGCIILESEASAKKRSAAILGEVIGFATNASGVHMAHADGDSIVNCLQDALKSANLKPADIDYINAHATGTVIGDASEAEAVRRVFNSNHVPVSSLKGYFGHTLGASGVLELIAVMEMMKTDVILPTRNLDTPDEVCKGINHVQSSINKKINTVVKNSFAFGGINTVLIIKR
ncbi:MAG TPA: beta-ketoacyl-[acyl-carrier-protein] synthase family protein, partial [Caldithrix sp.]|nr:beta-ketoacyl-[acyl-carrier-protein] synthase family protein [Caldithrix sp.]